MVTGDSPTGDEEAFGLAQAMQRALPIGTRPQTGLAPILLPASGPDAAATISVKDKDPTRTAIKKRWNECFIFIVISFYR
jgi:hypothetical protein